MLLKRHYLDKMKILRLIIVSLQAVILMAACGADDYEFENKYRCNFFFDCSIHAGTDIQSCVNPMSSGLFCMVWQQSVDGIRHIKTQLYKQQTKDLPITTAIELRQPCILGANNGLVIGCSTLNNGELFAFDRQCPNCIGIGSSSALEWSTNGLHLKCPKCERTYDLNNNGFIVSGEKGDKLMRYRASFSGTILVVGN